jgi:hypothetical protein
MWKKSPWPLSSFWQARFRCTLKKVLTGDQGEATAKLWIAFGLYVDCGAFPPLLFLFWVARKKKQKQKRRKSAAVQKAP